MIRFIETWFGHDSPPDFCAVVSVCGRPVDIIASGVSREEVADRVHIECARQLVPVTYVEIVDMRTMNALRRGALETLTRIDREMREGRPSYLVYEGGVWWQEDSMGCGMSIRRKPYYGP